MDKLKGVDLEDTVHLKPKSSKLKITKPIFKIKNGEVEIFFAINRGHCNYIWLNYSNSKRNNRIWDGAKQKYNFCLQIRGVIEIDTAYIGKKLWGDLYLTRLFKKDFHVYNNESGDSVYQSGF